MNNQKKIGIAVSFLVFFFVAPLVFAATSTDFQTKAQKYISNNCGKRNLPNDESLFCFLYYKVLEHDSVLSSHTNQLNTLQAATNTNTNNITNLQNKIASLEAQINNTSSNKIKTVTFANNRPQPFNSEWVDVRGGFTNITFTLSITGGIANYGIHFTNDPTNATDQAGYTVQQFVQCDMNSMCPLTTIPILGNYYRISTGTANGNITASGILKNY